MRLFVTIMFAVVSVSSAQQHQQLDPAYLRQYYSQLAQQGGSQGAPREATPIFEQQEQPQYVQQSAPLKNVSLDQFSIPFREGWNVKCRKVISMKSSNSSQDQLNSKLKLMFQNHNSSQDNTNRSHSRNR